MSAGPTIRRSFTDGAYGQIHCRGIYPENTSKAAVVCLHMAPKSGRSFHDMLPYLAVDRRAIAPDFPGHGESSLPPEEPHVTIADFANSVWQAIDDRLGDVAVHLVGYHTGSMVAVDATRQRPDRVVSVVNIGAPMYTDDELAKGKEAFEPISIDAEGSRFRIMWERIMYHRGPGMTLQMAADSMAENLRAGDFYEWGHRAAFAYAKNYGEYLSTIEQPLLVMNLNDDIFEETKRVDAYLRNGKRIDYPQWSHGFLSAHAAAAAQEILQFVQQVEAND